MRKLPATIAFCFLSGSAMATTVTFELPGSEPPSKQKLVYDCDGRKIGATYINTDNNALAVLDLGDETVVTVNVLSGSGARYAGQQYIWWTKGNEADLYDLTKGEDTPLAHCRATG
jgi:membrane-bound inhibitor of C-type lysozyme